MTSPPELIDYFRRFYFFHFGKTCPENVTEADVTGLFASLLREEARKPDEFWVCLGIWLIEPSLRNLL
jgi:hypothetical protein